MAEQDFLSYKGKPLVRKGNTIYYGSTGEKYIVCLTVNSSVKDKVDIPDNVTVQLMYSDADVPRDRVIKTCTRDSIYEALDLGAVWLEKELNK